MSATLEARLGLHCTDIESAEPGIERERAVWRAKRLHMDLLKACKAGHPKAWAMLKRLELSKLGLTIAQMESAA